MLRAGAALFAAAVWPLVFCPAAVAQGGADAPRHLALARELVANVRPENNQYRLGGRFIGFPGDRQDATYAVQADCSGFLLAVFERAGYPTQSRMAFLAPSPKRKRPAAEDFVHSIETGKGFQPVRGVANIRPGDLLAHAMLDAADQRQTGTTGHVFLIDSVPRPAGYGNPVIAGTTQFEVLVIDTNDERVGADDTRLADPASKAAGLGRGTIRLYADAGGELVGWARTFRKAVFYSYDPRFPSSTKLRKAALGRPLP